MKKYFAFCTALLLTACATMSQEKLDQSLQQYIGQSATQVQQQLNLTQMGYRQAAAPVQTENALTYTILRNMHVPIGTPNIGTSATMGAAIPTPSKGNISVEMKCQIQFKLENNVVQSVHYVGKAC